MTVAELTASQVQSTPWSAAPSSKAVAGDIGVCHADCHEDNCRKAMRDQGCCSGRSARLLDMCNAQENLGRTEN